MTVYGGHYLRSDELAALGLGGVGKDVAVHTTCVLVGLENIRIGSHVRIDAFAILIAGPGSITLGDHVHIAAHALVSGTEGVEIADFVSISGGVRLYTRNDDYGGTGLTNPTVPAHYLRLHKGPLYIGRHVIVGSGSVVLPAVRIADGSVVGALSLVKQSLEPWGVYAGVPVRRLRDRSRALIELENQLFAEKAKEQMASPDSIE